MPIRKTPNLHLEIQTSRKSPVGILRSSFYENGKTKHVQYGRISGQSLESLKMLQLAFRGSVVPTDSIDDFKITLSKEYGASAATYATIKKLELDSVLSSQPLSWVNPCLAMIVGRIVYAGSKLSLCHQQQNSSLWEVCDVNGNIDVDTHCYEPLDELLIHQNIIQKKLAKKHIKEGQLILYDITSSYLEGEYSDSDLVSFGYNRDGKKGHEQIVIGLICNREGCPVAVNVFPGNTKDSTTVMQIVKQIKKDYGISDIIFVGDRGMTTKQNVQEIQKEEGLRLVTALTRADINDLVERKVIQLSLFDERNICEVTDSDHPNQRYIVCRNPIKATEDKDTLVALLKKTTDGLIKIEKYKIATTVEILGARVGKLLEHCHTGKYVTWRIDADDTKTKSSKHKLIWELNTGMIEHVKALAGCYVITANVEPKDMTAQEIVEAYKSLISVEQAFRSLKTVHLEMRPIYHRKDDRIRAHVFLCMLAYYVQWHMQKLLEPLSVEDKGKNRRWTFSNVIATLKQLTKNTCQVKGAEVIKVSSPTPEQKRIIGLLGIKI